ncbi:hypothetical protein NOCD_12465 [Nocardioides cavernae]|uniref:hypothetical protein n=1 Tax=Nocardioides TaxID=1839 RepID=UPI0012E34F3F|nr:MULTISPECIES: hypothetical protein [Nocardioides]MCK9824297.1 hypothetical protein [Nocardioides cavernae]
MNILIRSAVALAATVAISLSAVAAPAGASSSAAVDRAVTSAGVITNLTPPRIIGVPAYGNVLSADVGT